MAAKTDVHEHVESRVGHELSAEAMERLSFFQAVAASTRSEDGTTTWRNLVIALQPKRCNGTRLLEVSGFAVTGSDGKTQFRLTDFICHSGESFGWPINVVATPLSSTPCFLTVLHTLVDNAKDVEVRVWSWDVGGAPAPAIWFDWRCRVELPLFLS
jgi:hypothetical protein